MAHELAQQQAVSYQVIARQQQPTQATSKSQPSMPVACTPTYGTTRHPSGPVTGGQRNTLVGEGTNFAAQIGNANENSVNGAGPFISARAPTSSTPQSGTSASSVGPRAIDRGPRISVNGAGRSISRRAPANSTPQSGTSTSAGGPRATNGGRRHERPPRATNAGQEQNRNPPKEPAKATPRLQPRFPSASNFQLNADTTALACYFDREPDHNHGSRNRSGQLINCINSAKDASIKHTLE